MASTCTVECSRTENPEDIVKNLFDNVMKREWAEVVNIYGKYPWVHKNEITNSGQTALHVAITDPQENYVVVRKLLQHIKRDFDPFDVLNLKNKKGQTLLHLAATNGGKEKMCEIYFKVVGVEKASKLVRVRDNKGRTPLFLAVQYGRLNTFRYLHFILGDTGTDFSFCVRDDGRSILHEAIIKENFGKYVEKLKNEAGWNYVEFDTNTDIESGEVSNIARKNQPLIWSRITSCFGYFVEFIILGMAFIFGYGYTAVRNIYAEKEKHVWADRVLNELLEHATMYDVKLSYFPGTNADD